MVTANLKAELLEPSTGQIICTAQKTINMAYQPYMTAVYSVRLRISNGKVSYDRDITFSSLSTTSYKLSLTQTAYINWRGP